MKAILMNEKTLDEKVDAMLVKLERDAHRDGQKPDLEPTLTFRNVNYCVRMTAEKDAEIARLKSLLDRDRTGLAHALNAVRTIARAYSWIAAGEWGSYCDEFQTEETLRSEVGEALGQILATAGAALAASGARADEAFRGRPIGFRPFATLEMVVAAKAKGKP